MYRIKTLDELEVGDKVIIIDFKGRPKIVTVFEIFLEDGTFTYEEDVWDVSLEQIAVVED